MSKVPHFDLNRKKLEKLRNKLRRDGKKCSKIHKGKNGMFFFSADDREMEESKPEIHKVYKRKKAHY
jgi:hypothetical protein